MITFVSGIDTDVGKSFATGWLASRLLEAGRRVITQKLVQTGNLDLSEDILLHRRMMNCGLLPEDRAYLTMPEVYSYPCSPHLAARMDGRPLNLEKIAAASAELDGRYEEVLLEGAGGLMVPLTDDLLTIDFIAEHNYPLIFVTGGSLGSINHTLLSLEAIEKRKIQLVRVIYNLWSGRHDPVIDADTKDYLQRVIRTRFPSALWETLPIVNHASH